MKRCLRLMKPGAYLINAGRGKLVDLEALRRLLESGHIKGAALDVLPEEPKQAGDTFSDPLCTFDNVVLTPHIGGSTEEAQHNIGLEVSRKIIQFCEFGSLQGAGKFSKPQFASPSTSSSHCSYSP